MSTPMRTPKKHATAAKWNRLMVTSVESIHVDREQHIGVVRMPAGCCTDMTGAIKTLRKLDPDVRQIQAYAGAEIDTVYERDDAGYWTAYVKDSRGWRRGYPAKI